MSRINDLKVKGRIVQDVDATTSQVNGTKLGDRTQEGPRSSSAHHARRSGPRGSRSTEKDEKPSPTDTLPPVEDASSWPTPDSTGIGGERRKTLEKDKAEKLEKDEKGDGGPSKARQKTEWVAVPYVPTVNFQTPIPTRNPRGGRTGGARGGRDASGARGGHTGGTQNTATGLSQVTTTLVLATNPPSEARSRRENGTTSRSQTAPAPATAKKPSTDSSFAKEQRKPASATATDKPKDPASVSTSEVSKARVPSERRPECYQGP